MAEQSFPVLEQPLTDQQWKSVTLGIGDGVFDEGGNPYNIIDKNNASNTVKITVDKGKGYAHAILKGFYHKIDADVVLSIPPVSSETTYNIVLVYDPLNQSAPVTLKVLTALDRTGGKEYLILWKIVRKPNQLLTDSTFSKYRPTIAPVIQVDYPVNLPDHKSVLFGTRAICLYTGEEYKATFTRWRKISAEIIKPLFMGGWEITNKTGGIVAQPADNGYLYSWGFALRRTGPEYNLANNFGSTGTTLGTAIPESARPSDYVYFLAANGNNLMEGRLTSAGAIQLRSMASGTLNIPRDWGASVTVQWWAPSAPTYIAQ